MLDRLLNRDIPLIRQVRLDRNMAAITVPDLMSIITNILKQFFLPEPFDNSLSRLESIHTKQRLCFRLIRVIPPMLIAYRSVRRHHIDDVKIMPEPDLPVVRIMSRRNLQKTRRVFRFFILTLRIRQYNMFVRNDRYKPANNRKPHFLANKILRPRIGRIHRNRTIAQHSLRPRRRNSNMLDNFPVNLNTCLQRILQIPEETLDIFVLDFVIGQNRLRRRIPVNQSLPAINKPVTEQLKEIRPHSLSAHLVHRKTRPLPIARTTHTLKLVDDLFFVFLFPLLNTPDKFLPLKIGASFSLFAKQPFLNNCLSRNARMIRPRHPKSIETLHPAKTDQNILQRIIKRMPKMKRSRHIRRRYHYRIGSLIAARIRGKVVTLLPHFNSCRLNSTRFVYRRKLLTHNYLSDPQ